MSEGNGHGPERRDCDKHPGVTISFLGADCPMCSLQRQSEAIAFGSLRAGFVIVKLFLSGVPFGLNFQGIDRNLGAMASQELNAALEELQQRIVQAAGPLSVPKKPGLVVPA